MPEIFGAGSREFVEFTEELEDCTVCPHGCHKNRIAGQKGYCRTGSGFEVAAVVIHKGEEPVISGRNGICNVFFNGCNLRCVFCQNHQISHPSPTQPKYSVMIDNLLQEILMNLDSGCKSVGFVSPSHMVPHVRLLIKLIRKNNHNPVFVYNTNAYDTVESLRSLEGLIDVYLPDFKYMDTDLAKRYSGVSDYPETAKMAIREMFRQKGSTLITDDEGHAVSGLIIRHLVLPGNPDNSVRVLNYIAEEISVKVYISLMSQYYPAFNASRFQELNTLVTAAEYNSVLAVMEKLGLNRGWSQELDSFATYRPDFRRQNPF